MEGLRISQLAERAGVTASALRFYESAGLLTAGRTAGGYRVYGEDAVERLAFIGAAKRLGLPLEEVAELLGVWDSGSCADVKADLRPRVARRLAEAGARAAELAEFTAQLHRALDHLDALPDLPGRCGPGCGLLDPGADRAVERWRSAPVACSLGEDGVGERAAEWRTLVEGADRQDVRDGVRFTLPAGRAAAIAGLAVAEQECCPFFDFRLHLDGPVVHLDVRAPAEGAALLNDLFGPPRSP